MGDKVFSLTNRGQKDWLINWLRRPTVAQIRSAQSNSLMKKQRLSENAMKNVKEALDK